MSQQHVSPDKKTGVERSRFFSQFGVPVGARCPASALYQQHSELTPEWDCPLSAEEVTRLTLDSGYKRYPDASRVNLPPPSGLQFPLESAIRARRTAGAFCGDSITCMELATLLRLGCGVTGDGRPPLRAAPSAGALYPIEVYPFVFHVSGIESALYHYVPADGELERLRAVRGVEDLWPALPPGWHGEPVAAAVALTARLPRVQAKYGERGYRFALLETGHIAQNLSLGSTALDLATACVGGFFDDALNSLLGVDGREEAALYLILIGRAPTGNRQGTDG